MSVAETDSRRRQAVSLPQHHVFAAGLDQQAGAVAATEPRHPFDDFQIADRIRGQNGVPYAGDQIEILHL